MVFPNSLSLSVKMSVYTADQCIQALAMVGHCLGSSGSAMQAGLLAIKTEANARIQQLEARIEKLESLLKALPPSPLTPPVTETAEPVGEVQNAGEGRYCIAGHPDLGTFCVTSAPPSAPPQQAHWSVRKSVIFQEARWSMPIPADGVLKPHYSSDFFWPATRARYIYKAINKSPKRQTYDANMRYIANSLQMSLQDLVKTNPVVIGRKLGMNDADMSRMFGDWSTLSRGYCCRYF